MELLHGLEKAINTTSNFLWGYPLVILLFGTHIFLTFRLRFIQRYIGKAIKLSVTPDKGSRGDVSQFGALTTSLAATIGTGNIMGVGSAIALGGPGAVFWMWLTGVFGIATKYSEAVLAVKYRVTNEKGEQAGGPMYVLARGLKMPWLGTIFAALTAVAAFGIGNMVQSHSIAELVGEEFGIKAQWTGLILMVLTAMVILGGIRNIARVCEGLIPFMAVFYVTGCIVLLVMHADRIPGSLELIFKSAFTGHAAIGGFVGTTIREAIRMGVSRGLFSNESGLGSAPIVAAAARTRNPVRQGLVSATGTFWDTVVICLITGLVIVNSGAWTAGEEARVLTRHAFQDIPYIGTTVLTLGLFTFVFSTILGWSYYGEKAAEYLFGRRVVKPYRWMWVGAVYVGAIVPSSVWSFADLANGLMALPNLIALLALSGVVVAETKKFLWEGDINASGDDGE
ncbi:sodium:alanine symporter family protein [candidate division BRC1 bacterium HGW-BRC1-1]|jgi:AGCS family alanine or glycine:cation symporter|nr:MAG: sodium:alanine symporter family protein [candidate division BRC1 bacterium HGW-BRC1-1]